MDKIKPINLEHLNEMIRMSVAQGNNLRPLASILRDEKNTIPMTLRNTLADLIDGEGFSRTVGYQIALMEHPEVKAANSDFRRYNKFCRIIDIGPYLDAFDYYGSYDVAVTTIPPSIGPRIPNPPLTARSKKEAMGHICDLMKISHSTFKKLRKCNEILKDIHPEITEIQQPFLEIIGKEFLEIIGKDKWQLKDSMYLVYYYDHYATNNSDLYDTGLTTACKEKIVKIRLIMGQKAKPPQGALA